MNEAKLTFLGTGTSQGVPMIGCDCRVCTSADPRDRRLRSSALVEYGGLTILVDAGPDFRYQMLRSGVRHLDAILLTHNHKDHTGGLDDVRSFNLLEAKPVNIWCEEYVERSLRMEYSYAFAEKKYPGSPEWHVHRITGEAPFEVFSNAGEETLVWESGYGYRHIAPGGAGLAGGSGASGLTDGVGASGLAGGAGALPSVTVVPVQGYHNKARSISVLGYRFGNIAYLTDMNLLEDSELEKLRGLDAVTLNCVKIGTHHSHFSLSEVLNLFERIGARRSYITHISHMLPPHADFQAMLPDGVFAAYDGQVID